MAGSIFLFILSAFDFLKLIVQNDREILWISLPLILIRAGALGSGLAIGFLFPPRAKKPARPGLNIFERLTKRLIDICGALIGIIFGFPIVLISMFAIQLDSKGRPIFVQERIGKHGKPFKMYKLRTMFLEEDEESKKIIIK